MWFCLQCDFYALRGQLDGMGTTLLSIDFSAQLARCKLLPLYAVSRWLDDTANAFVPWRVTDRLLSANVAILFGNYRNTSCVCPSETYHVRFIARTPHSRRFVDQFQPSFSRSAFQRPKSMLAALARAWVASPRKRKQQSSSHIGVELACLQNCAVLCAQKLNSCCPIWWLSFHPADKITTKTTTNERHKQEFIVQMNAERCCDNTNAYLSFFFPFYLPNANYYDTLSHSLHASIRAPPYTGFAFAVLVFVQVSLFTFCRRFVRVYARSGCI